MATASTARPRTWLTEEEIRTLQGARDQNELARLISQILPDGSREEIVFRYHLSRTVYLGEYELPPLPATAMRVMQLARDPKVDARDYARVIHSDPALVSAIVRVANSSFFATVSGCSSLEQAIVRIGLREVEKVAMIETMRSRVFRAPGREALVRELVRHGVDVSIVAQVAAARTGAGETEAFLGGLFHDVGKLLLLQTIAAVQQKLGWQAPHVLVTSAFEAFHASVGEQLCRKWEFPETICEAVRWHHDPERAAASSLSQIVYLANRIGHYLDSQYALDGLFDEDDPVVRASGVTTEGLVAVREEARRRAEAFRPE